MPDQRLALEGPALDGHLRLLRHLEPLGQLARDHVLREAACPDVGRNHGDRQEDQGHRREDEAIAELYPDGSYYLVR